ncbi:MAG: glycosyltransferase [Acidobacteriota bacterium]
MSRVPRYAPVSLVTTVLNDLEGCRVFFAAMERQTLCPHEIVIVDGGSQDGTWEFLQAYRPQLDYQIVVSREDGCNVARGRNLAIQRAAHDIIVSTDIGCQWDDRWLEELATPLLENPALEAVMGSWMVRYADLPDVWARVEFALHQEFALRAQPDSHASSRAIAYRKRLWEQLGGYPEDLTLAADDMVFALLLHAATTRVTSAPVPRCFWERPATLRRFRREAERNFFGAGEADIWRKYGLLVGGRLLAELLVWPVGLLVSAFEILWLRRLPAIGGLLLLAGTTLTALRLWRLGKAFARYRAQGGKGGWWRLPLFEYATKWSALRGYWRGWWQGRRQCQRCRQRLRQAGVSPW